MSGFSSDWLALREPYDERARNPLLLEAVKAWASERHSISVVDLASGTGAAMRALSPHLPMHQRWRLVDNDLSLLARVSAPPSSRVAVATTPVDLAHDLEAALDGAVDLVTTSALLDLVSQEWLDRLVTELAARHLPFYATLNYDGRIIFTPEEDGDATVVSAVNRHQRSEKGFGAALGPEAAMTAVRRFRRVGYKVDLKESDWVLDRSDKAIQLELLNGYAGIARSMDTSLAIVAGWFTRRRELISAGSSELRVGHIDFFARPIGRR